MIKKIWNFFFKKKEKSIPMKEVLPPKDPLDSTLSDSSTKWKKEYYCMVCKKEATDIEAYSRVCSHCGNVDDYMFLRERTKRKIWNGEKWIVQRKYGNDLQNYTLSDE